MQKIYNEGNKCIPVVDSCWYMAKPIQYCKVKKKKNLKNKDVKYGSLFFILDPCLGYQFYI